MKLYVGNLSPNVNEDDLRQAFAVHGQVSAVSIVTDKFTGVSRGFGFVEMPGKAEAQTAIDRLNYQELKGQTIKVNEARPNPQAGGRGGGRGRRF